MSILFNFLISPRQFIFKGSFQDLDGFTKPETYFFKFISHATTRRRNENPDLTFASLRRRVRPILDRRFAPSLLFFSQTGRQGVKPAALQETMVSSANSTTLSEMRITCSR
jgi:hypothetical protein